jgi:hypothetical protein
MAEVLMLRYSLDTIVIYVLKRRPVEVLSTSTPTPAAWHFRHCGLKPVLCEAIAA